ncbi:MAG TPA: hypothetical protein VIV11_15820 [Kofleriaceae bacterium]
MRLAALVVGFLLVLTADARAGGVDWSEYIDKDGSSKVPASKTPTNFVDMEADAAADETPKATKATKATKGKKAAKAKRVARASKAKGKKGAKAKSAKTKKRR